MTERITASVEKLNWQVTAFLVNRTPAVERSGEGQWFIDLTGCERLFRNDFAGWGVQIADLLKNHFGLITQIGIASNKVTAELACRVAKPGSALWLFPEGEKELITRVSLEHVPGLTDRQRQIFRDRRLQWAWEVIAMGEDYLRQWLGNREGSEAWKALQGICDEPVKACRIPRALKKTYAFSPVTNSRQDIIRAGVYLSGAVYHEIRRLGGVMRKISCRLVYVDDLEICREIHLGELRLEEEYVAAVARMLEHVSLRRVQARMLSLSCPIEFEAIEQPDFFCERERLKRRDLDKALKDVREKYGVESLYRASGVVRGMNRRRRAGL